MKSGGFLRGRDAWEYLKNLAWAGNIPENLSNGVARYLCWLGGPEGCNSYRKNSHKAIPRGGLSVGWPGKTASTRSRLKRLSKGPIREIGKKECNPGNLRPNQWNRRENEQALKIVQGANLYKIQTQAWFPDGRAIQMRAQKPRIDQALARELIP